MALCVSRACGVGDDGGSGGGAGGFAVGLFELSRRGRCGRAGALFFCAGAPAGATALAGSLAAPSPLYCPAGFLALLRSSARPTCLPASFPAPCRRLHFLQRAGVGEEEAATPTYPCSPALHPTYYTHLHTYFLPTPAHTLPYVVENAVLVSRAVPVAAPARLAKQNRCQQPLRVW